MKRSFLLLALIIFLTSGCKPTILSVTPTSPVSLDKNQSQVFTVMATGNNLTYAWELDTIQQSESTNSFTYTAAESDIGAHTLKVIITNPSGSAEYKWTITVMLEISYIWEQQYGGSGQDITRAIAQTADGGYIAAGSSTSTDIPDVTNKGGTDVYIIKLASTGTVEWQNMYGGSAWDSAYAVMATSDGGCIVAGDSGSEDCDNDQDGNILANNGLLDFFVLKLDSNGNIEWENLYGGTRNDQARSIILSETGGFLVAGHSASSELDGHNGMSDGLLIKLDDNGNVEWQKTYGSDQDENISGIAEVFDASGAATGYILVGNETIAVIDSRFYAVYTDLSGNVIWENAYFSTERPGPRAALDVIQASDSHFIVTGFSSCYLDSETNAKPHTIKLDSSSGEIIWESIAGGSEWDQADAIQALPNDTGYIVVGKTQTEDLPGCEDFACETFDIYLGLIDINGTTILEERHGGLGMFDLAYDIAGSVNETDEPDGFIIAGQKGTLDLDAYIIKIGAL